MNILGYSKKQQATFEEVPLNAVDILICACLSYYDFENLKDYMPFSLNALIDNTYFKSNEAYKDTYVFLHAKQLIKRLMVSKRFKDAELLEYHLVSDKKISFAAIAIKMAGKIIVAFRGTDPSYVGWKEDFYLSYKNSIRSYSLAVAFIDEIMNKYSEQIYICGHSKGGHISTYILNEIYNFQRLDGVYDFDGPGFRKENMFKGKEDRLKIYHKLVPQDSLVGALFSSDVNIEVIKSYNAGGFLQHNPFEWVIKDNDFVYEKRRSFSSRYIDRCVNEWIESFTDEEKEKFTNIFFDALEETGTNDLTALLKKMIFLQHLKPFYRVYKKLNKEDKKLFHSVMKRFAVTFLSVKKIKELA